MRRGGFDEHAWTFVDCFSRWIILAISKVGIKQKRLSFYQKCLDAAADVHHCIVANLQQLVQTGK